MSNEPNTQPEPQGDAPAPDVAALQAELEKARDTMLRALADAENTRRRAEKQAVEARVYAIDRFAGDLLPVADTLARALQAVPAEVREHPDDALRNLIAGLELTERSLIDAFARHGLKRVGAKGDAFDPNLHQAVAQAPSDVPAGRVAEVMQPGYVLGDRTIRAAMVLVSGGPAGGHSETAHVDVKV
ncbi:nucleotide exchange factor GrpE [Terricaulis sp.]|uniref:nucleotide exchange factor GrpE n=1 Tax=Terricaulis sp. TaxID=2768686 RepID=UPI003784D37A